MNKLLNILHSIKPFTFSGTVIATILILTLLPQSTSTLPSFPYADKVAHFFMFGGLGCTLLWDMALLRRSHPSWKIYGIAAITASLVGGAIELMQGSGFVTRSCDIADFFADSAGAFILPLIFRNIIWHLLPEPCHITLATVNVPSDKLQEVYLNSFPPEERRHWNDIVAKAGNDSEPLQFTEIRLFGKIVGLLSWWNFGQWAYLEHFAIDSRMRGSGIGHMALRKWVKNIKMPSVLEVELPGSNPMAARRISFYERSGFKSHPGFSYVQPPYAPGLPSVPLMLMTCGNMPDLKSVAAILHKKVYQAL